MGNYIYTPEAWGAAQAAGLTENDWNLFRNWYFSDPEVFSTARIQEIANSRDTIPGINSLPRLFGEYISSGLVPIILLILVLLLATIIPLVGLDRRILLRSFLAWAIGFVVLYGVYIYGRLPQRIAIPAVIVISLTVLIGIASTKIFLNQQKPSTKPLTTATVAVPALVLAVTPIVLTVQSNQPFPSQQAFPLISGCLDDLREPALVFTSYSNSALAQVDPFQDPTMNREARPKAVLLGWQARSPDHTRHAQSLGFSAALLDEVASGEAVIVTTDPNDPMLVANFLREHRGLNVTWEDVGPCNPSIPGEPMVKRAVSDSAPG